MSLKFFHIFFILVCILFTLGLAIWQFEIFRSMKTWLSLLAAIASFIASQALVIYLFWFIKKMKRQS